MKIKFLIGLVVIGALSLIYNAIAWVLLFVAPRSRTRELGQRGISLGYRFFWHLASSLGVVRLDLRALDALRGAGPIIVAPNHPALLDALLVASRIPVVCVMKSAVVNNIFLGAGARLACYIGNNPPQTMIREAVGALGRGEQVLMFPEGTRTTIEPIGPLKRGITAIACRAQVPIQTVFIETNSPFLRKGWPIWRLPPLPIEISVRLGKRFAPCSDRERLFADLDAYYRAELSREPCREAGPAMPVPSAASVSVYRESDHAAIDRNDLAGDVGGFVRH